MRIQGQRIKNIWIFLLLEMGTTPIIPISNIFLKINPIQNKMHYISAAFLHLKASLCLNVQISKSLGPPECSQMQSFVPLTLSTAQFRPIVRSIRVAHAEKHKTRALYSLFHSNTFASLRASVGRRRQRTQTAKGLCCIEWVKYMQHDCTTEGRFSTMSGQKSNKTPRERFQESRCPREIYGTAGWRRGPVFLMSVSNANCPFNKPLNYRRKPPPCSGGHSARGATSTENQF